MQVRRSFLRMGLITACGLSVLSISGLVVIPSYDTDAQPSFSAAYPESVELEKVRATSGGASDVFGSSDNLQSDQPLAVEGQVTAVSGQFTRRKADAMTDEPAQIPSTTAQAAFKKSASSPDVPPELSWQRLTVQSGDSLSALFDQAGFSSALMRQVIVNEGRKLTRLHTGDELHFGTRDGELREIVLVKSPTERLRAQLTNDGYITKKELSRPEVELAFAAGEVESSLFIAAKEAGLDARTTLALSDIFKWDIDFVNDIRKGDSFEVLYEKRYLEGEEIGGGRILAAYFVNRGSKITAVQYTDESGKTAFYTPEGESLQKAFLSAPIDARISSSFNLQRRHPVLDVVRPHEGTDYAAATGSPIVAAGDGKVRFKGWKGGYGRAVVLQHGDDVTTLYAHMSRFAPGIARAEKVEQGQTIGYVGSSGMVTGAHLHYEFRLNGSPRNSRTVKLPDATPVPKQEMARFKAHANKLVGRLDRRAEGTQVALTKDSGAH